MNIRFLKKECNPYNNNFPRKIKFFFSPIFNFNKFTVLTLIFLYLIFIKNVTI